MKLFGNLAVIAGPAAGIGYMTALALYRAGAFVIIADPNPARGQDAADRLYESGHCLQRCESVEMNTADPISVRRAAATILRHDRPVDILVNTVSWDGQDSGDQALNALLPSMIERRRGKVINVACNTSPAKDAQIAFDAWADGGIVTPTRKLAAGLRRYGISVNCICLESALAEETVARGGDTIPANLTAQPGNPQCLSEIEGVTLLFACATANRVTGQALHLHY